MFLELIEKQNRRTFDFNIIKLFQLDTIYKDQYGDGHETFRAIRHSIIGISVGFALVFDDRVESWAEFFNGRFKELLIPHFLKISKLANVGDYSAIIAEDQNFIEELEDQSASRLVEAAAAIFDAREGAKGMSDSIKLGKPLENVSVNSIADSLSAPLHLEYSYNVAKSVIDEMVTVTDDEMKEFMIYAFDNLKLMLEPACVAELAAIKYKIKVKLLPLLNG